MPEKISISEIVLVSRIFFTFEAAIKYKRIIAASDIKLPETVGKSPKSAT